MMRSGVLVLAGVVGTHEARAEPARASLLERPVVTVGGGVEGFITSELRDRARDGGAWSARVSAGGRKDIRLELAYAGSAQPLDGMEGSVLLGTGIIGMLRINIAPWVSDTIEPFFLVGAGWTRFQVRDRRASASLVETDDILDMPIGFGVARRFGGYVLDVRAGVTLAAGADLLPVEQDPDASRATAVMHRFGMTASVGFEL